MMLGNIAAATAQKISNETGPALRVVGGKKAPTQQMELPLNLPLSAQQVSPAPTAIRPKKTSAFDALPSVVMQCYDQISAGDWQAALYAEECKEGVGQLACGIAFLLWHFKQADLIDSRVTETPREMCENIIKKRTSKATLSSYSRFEFIHTALREGYLIRQERARDYFPPMSCPDPKGIAHACAETLNLSYKDLISASRASQFAQGRQMLSIFLKTHLDLTLVQIGKTIGNRDHSTALNALNRAREMMRGNAAFSKNFERFVRAVDDRGLSEYRGLHEKGLITPP